MPRRERMKTLAEIQRMHDVLDHVGPGEHQVLIQYPELLACIIAQRDALCWVLGHGDEASIAKTASVIEGCLERHGVKIVPIPEVN